MIDASEAALAVVGVCRVLDGWKYYTVEQRERADGLEDRVSRAAAGVVNGTFTAPPAGDHDYDATLKKLAAGWDDGRLTEVIHACDDRAIGTAFAMHAKDAIDKLHAAYPVSVYPRVTGAINLPPPATKQFQIAGLVCLVDEPMRVFGLMADGGLLRSEAKFFRDVYPTLSLAIDSALLEAVVAAKNRSASFELSERAEYGVSAWFGTDRAKKLSASLATAQSSQARKQDAGAMAAQTKKMAPASDRASDVDV